jgi:beta-glucosidase
MPSFPEGDLEIISQPLDFFGANIYHGTRVQAGPLGERQVVRTEPWEPRTAFNWPVVPDALYWGPRFFYERYQKPILITENGVSSRDWVSLDGKVHDPARIDFMTRYLRSLRRAVSEGVDVRGYFHWSFMDNFEWAEGYKERFGLYFVDFETQARIAKDSAHFYQRVISTRGGALD